MPTYEVNFWLMNIRGEKKTVEPTMTLSGDFANEEEALSTLGPTFRDAYPHKTFLAEAVTVS